MKYPHIRQHDEKDCGAACLSMICEYYGLKLPIARFRELIKVDNLGSNIYGILKGAEKIGLNGDPLEGNPDELMKGVSDKEVTFPFIARIINEEMYEHFVVVYGIKKNKVYIGDPAKTGIIKLPIEYFFQQWQQQIIVLNPNSNFKKENKRKGALKKFSKLITNQKKLLTMVFLVSLIISAISLSASFIFEYIIDDAVTVGDVNGELIEDEHNHEHEDEHEHDETNGSSFLEKAEEKISVVFENLDTVCISVIMLYIIQALLQVLRGYMLAVMIKNVELPLSLGYYNHLIDLPTRFFGTRKTGELISRFSDTSNIRDALSTATLTIMLDTLMAIAAGIFLFTISYKLFIITVIILAFYTAVMLSFRKPIKIINQDIMEQNAQITAYLKESIDGIETVKAYKYENSAKEKTSTLFIKFVNKVVHGTIVFNLQEVLVGVAESIGTVFLLWSGAYLCIKDIISIGSLITFYYLLSYFLNPVKNLINLQPELQTAMVAAERLNDILDVELENNSKENITKLNGDIICKDIDFRYGYRNLVLNNISLTFKNGSKTAIVGESGCGKTTLAKLLMQFYNPEKGSITVGGKNLADFSPESVRNRISYISQDIFLFSDTIFNNLRIGNRDITDEEIVEMCKKCGANEFIENLPMGYQTVLEENGNNLSGGQKQRLAIVRALLKKPDILIMDEATSNLDTVTEQSIKNLIDSLSKQITCIIIAHRLTTIKSCDYIYVMDKGTVAEEGTHIELLKKNGIYKALTENI